ncbi:MAG: ATP-binding protein [Pseudohongiellaceae bacterium]|nr:ATP-binding protein [Pseudohongiellaceae bacterium]
MASIRLFLTLTLISIIVLVSFLSSLRGYRESMLEAEQLFDLQLLEYAKLLNLLNPQLYDADNPQVIERLIAPTDGDASLSAEMRLAYQIFDESQNLVLRSVAAPVDKMTTLEVGYHDVNFSGYRWRSLVVAEPRNKHWVVVAQRYDVRYELAESIILQAVLPTVVGIPIAAVLIWFIVGYGLRPIKDLASAVHAREVSDLTAVQLDNVPRELTPLTQSTNELLKRLQSSFEREKRFAADAAHELRTPISVLKVQMHNLLAEMSNDNQSIQELRQGIEAMEQLVEQILVLNRTAPDQYMMQFSKLDFHALAQELLSIEYQEFANKDQNVELIGGETFVLGDQTALRSLIQNLLRNASKYTPAGGSIVVTVSKLKEGATVIVEDSGPGIAEEFRQRVFDRFYRLQGDQHDSGIAGSGLGLAIVKHIVDMHSASISLAQSQHLGGLKVTVVFPADSKES